MRSDPEVPFEVGHEYAVLHVKHCRNWYPVLGPPHEDPSFAPNLGAHIHYHPQFIQANQIHIQIPDLSVGQIAQVIAHKLRGGEQFEMRQALCLREMPVFPRWHQAAPWVSMLEMAHQGCRVQNGRCPHAGTDGRRFPRAADGSWECIHGLRWSASGNLMGPNDGN